MFPDLPAAKKVLSDLLDKLRIKPIRPRTYLSETDAALCLLTGARNGHKLGPEFDPLNDNVKAALCNVVQVLYSRGYSIEDNPYPVKEALKAALAAISPKISPNDPRDKFIYESREKGRSLAWIKAEVEKCKNWGVCDSEQAVSRAAMRYATRQSLPWPIKR